MAFEHGREFFESLTIQTHKALHEFEWKMILDKFGPKHVTYHMKNIHGAWKINIMMNDTEDQRRSDVPDCARLLISEECANLRFMLISFKVMCLAMMIDAARTT